MAKIKPLLLLLLIPFSLILPPVIVCAESSKELKSDVTGDSVLTPDTELGMRIIGGERARPGQYPFVARLIINFRGTQQSLCSGTVLNSRAILTAAHCVYSNNRKAEYLWALIIGSYRYSYKYFSSNEMYLHPSYNENFSHDIAIIMLSPTQTLLNYGIAPSLPSHDTVDDMFVNTAAVVSGWGKTSDKGGVSSTLQYANVNIIDNKRCQSFYGPVVKPNVICTLDINKGICGGDSGGPLMIKRGRVNVIVGVNAFATTRCELYSPSGYTYVYPYITWINQILTS